ncbi:MAG: tetratricopeptide repeat protein [Candidatus Hodarchaeota archaeon]
MPKTPQEELSRAELLLKKGNYSDALELVETLAAEKELSLDDHLACLLLESRLRIKLGELEKSLLLAEEVLQAGHVQENLLPLINAFIIKTEVSWRSGKLDEGLRILEKAQGLLKGTKLEDLGEKEQEIKLSSAELLHHKAIIYWFKGDLEQTLEYQQQVLAINEELGNKKGIAASLDNLGLAYASKGDINRALDYHHRSLAIYEALSNKHDFARSLGNLSNAYAMKGDLDQALKHQERSLAIKVEIGNKIEIGWSLINLGVIYQFKGDLKQALEYYQRSLIIFEELGNKRGFALALNNLGDAYQLKGDFSQALEYHLRSLTLYEELGIKQDIAMSLLNIGEIYRKKGKSNYALDYYQRSLSICEAIENDIMAAIALQGLVCVALDHNPPQAQQYLQKLQQISEKADNLRISQRYRVAKALSLKASKRAYHKVKAAEILEKLVEEEVTDHSQTVTAMIHLCDLLILELKATGEEWVLEKAKDLIQQLHNIAKKQSSHLLLAETYLLQSKFALIELDVEGAKNLLTQASIIAEEKDLHMLARAVAHERDLLLSQLHKWELIVKENPSKQEMIDITRIDDMLEQMIQKTVTILAQDERIISTRDVPKKKYQLEYLDLLKDSPKIEKSNFRVAIAQIGVSQAGDILHEFYEEKTAGLFGLRKDKVETIELKVKEMINIAHNKEVSVVLFPELAIDLNYDQLLKEIIHLAKIYNMYIIPGSYHEQVTKRNISVVIGPDGILWRQEKHIPAIIHQRGERLKEGIEVETLPRKTIICKTELGAIAVTICRDFLDMDLRVELKNSKIPVDLIFNPAFTPVTADFKAAHFDARRSIYAYCFFANIAEIGDSFIYTPEKERVERTIPAKQEGLIYKDVDLFRLRSERRKWENEQTKQRSFIQSTRS